MKHSQSGRAFCSLIVAVINLAMMPAPVLADDGEIFILRDVPAHVPYRAIPPGQVESSVNASPASQVNSAVGNSPDHRNRMIAKELNDAEVAALGSVASARGAQTPSRQGTPPANMDALLGATRSNADEWGGLNSTFGAAGSLLSNSVNSATGGIGRTVSGALANLGGH